MSFVSEEYKRWEKRRRWTTIAFTIESLLIGMEYSVTFLTLWLYIKDLLKPKYPKTYYAIISACYLSSGVILSLIVGGLVDRYRNINKTFIILNTMVIIGNIIYSLPFSPWLLIAGRLIAGAGGPIRPIISSELARCYPSDQLSSKLAVMAVAFSTGFIVGPAINFVFVSINISIGAWRITYVNVPGLYMAALFIVVEVICIFMVFDLSKEYDLKAEICSAKFISNKKESSTDNHHENCTIASTVLGINTSEDSPLLEKNVEIPSICKVFKLIFYDIDAALLMVTTFVSNYLIVTFDMWLPLLVY